MQPSINEVLVTKTDFSSVHTCNANGQNQLSHTNGKNIVTYTVFQLVEVAHFRINSKIPIRLHKDAHHHCNIRTADRAIYTFSSHTLAQLSQKRACPRGKNAKPSRGATRQTSQHSCCVAAASGTAVVAAADVDAAVSLLSVESRRRRCCYRCRLQ